MRTAKEFLAAALVAGLIIAGVLGTHRGPPAPALSIQQLIAVARTLTDEGRYREATGVVDQILTLDPRNDYALGVRPLLVDKEGFVRQRLYRERAARALLSSATERPIPYDDLLVYPVDWPDISAIRDQSITADRGENREERQRNETGLVHGDRGGRLAHGRPQSGDANRSRFGDSHDAVERLDGGDLALSAL